MVSRSLRPHCRKPGPEPSNKVFQGRRLTGRQLSGESFPALHLCFSSFANSSRRLPFCPPLYPLLPLICFSLGSLEQPVSFLSRPLASSAVREALRRHEGVFPSTSYPENMMHGHLSLPEGFKNRPFLNKEAELRILTADGVIC